MNVRTLILVVLAIICGASAAIGVNELRQRTLSNAPQVESVPVVVATIDVSRGTALNADSLVLKAWPKDLVPPGSISRVEDAVDRSVIVPLVRGEPVLVTKLADTQDGGGLASMIPRGMRAFTIQTPHVASGVGGFVLPGNRVDVLLTTDSRGANDPTGGGSTTTLLQNVVILAVAQWLEAPAERKVDVKDLNSVTLLVTPDQATKLDLGMNKGKLHLSLRHPEDHLEADTKPVTLAQLRHLQVPPVIRFDGLADAFTNALTIASSVMTRNVRPEVEVPPEPQEAEEPVRPMRRDAWIMTLRGVHRGSVRIAKR